MDTTLHSNMFLLIPGMSQLVAAVQSFTFQYVSINTDDSVTDDLPVFSTLHSNMFLLIRL